MHPAAIRVFRWRWNASSADLSFITYEVTKTYRHRYSNKIQLEHFAPRNQNEVQTAFLHTTDCRRSLQHERWHDGHSLGDGWQMIRVRGSNSRCLSAFGGVTTVYAGTQLWGICAASTAKAVGGRQCQRRHCHATRNFDSCRTIIGRPGAIVARHPSLSTPGLLKTPCARRSKTASSATTPASTASGTWPARPFSCGEHGHA